MAKSLRPRRGSSAQHAVFVGDAGELTVDTSRHSVVVHDGVTPGGFDLKRELADGTGSKLINFGPLMGHANAHGDVIVSKLSGLRELNPEEIRLPNESDDSLLQRAAVLASTNKWKLVLSKDYTLTASGQNAVKLTDVNFFYIECRHCVVTCVDKGIEVSLNAGGVAFYINVSLKRSSQAPWGSSKTGILVSGGKSHVITGSSVTRFCDAYGADGTLSNPLQSLTITDCEGWSLGEEVVAVRANVERVVCRDVRGWNHLGDGILVKSAKRVTVDNCRIFDGANNTSTNWAELTAGVIGNPALPKIGGGITCNDEGQTGVTEYLKVINNHVEQVGYGIAFIGSKSSIISKNTLKNITATSAIELSNKTAFNPGNQPSYDIQITGNIIDGLLRATETTAIFAKTGAVSVGRVIITGNIVTPNGIHFGITADNGAVIMSNIIRRARRGIDVTDGVAQGNLIFDEFVPGVSIAARNNSAIVGNIVKGASAIYVRGNNVTCSSNILNGITANNPIVIDGAYTGVVITGNSHPENKKVGFANGGSANGNCIFEQENPGSTRLSTPLNIATNDLIPLINFVTSTIPDQYWSIGNVLPDGTGSLFSIRHNGTDCIRIQNDNKVTTPRGFKVASSWNSNDFLEIGVNNFFWVDTSSGVNKLRMKSGGRPISETDGVVIGSQA